MSEPIITTTRVSDKPVRWMTCFVAHGAHPEGDYDLQIIGFGKTPELAQANAATNLERVKLRMLVASLAFKSRVPETTESAEG